MTLTLIESPFAPSSGHDGLGLTDAEYQAAIAENLAYAKAAVRDCLARGESPYASHLFFTQEGLLDDRDPKQRCLGIEAGLLWGARADKTVVYVDRGISRGMLQGIERALSEGRRVVYRSLIDGREWDSMDKAMPASKKPLVGSALAEVPGQPR